MTKKRYTDISRFTLFRSNNVLL